MYKDRIRILADTIEKLENYDYKTVYTGAKPTFTMSKYYYKCGSPACMSGWARSLFAPGSGKDDKDLLGLSDSMSRDLFLPLNDYVNWRAMKGSAGYISARHAAAVLRNLADTGKVDWSVGYEKR